jgi:hypothetical protein
VVKETAQERKDQIVGGLRKGYTLDAIQDALEMEDKTMLWYLMELVKEGRVIVSVA